MDLSNLKPAKGAIKRSKRLGRGQGSGKGGTSTKGNKGAKARSGNKRRIGFEGGQMPIHRRVPKYGFKNINRIEYKTINLGTLQKLVDEKNLTSFDQEVYARFKFAKASDKVKILGKGQLTSQVQVKAHSFSASALKAIEAVGGSALKI